MLKIIVIALILNSFSQKSLAQQNNQPRIKVTDNWLASSLRNRDVGQYINAFKETPELFTASQANKMQWAYPFVGRHDLMLIEEGKQFTRNTTPGTCETEQRVIGVENPADTLIERAKEHRIFIINENHSQALQRLFLLQNLEKFEAAGYTHLALEMFSHNPESQIELNPDTEFDVGFYSHDPILANSIRKANTMGFKLIPYEMTKEQRLGIDPDWGWKERIPLRENSQAENLVSVIKNFASNDKILIYVGYSHNKKGAFSKTLDAPAMAASLMQKLNEDVYSVNMVDCSIISKSGDLTPILYQTENQMPPTYKKEYLNTLYNAVVHLPMLNKEMAQTGMYRRFMGKRVDIPGKLRNLSGSILVEAYRIGQDTTSMPYDRLWLDEGENAPLYLPVGNYIIRAHTDDGVLLGSENITIEN